jgi:anti-anti-sigma factor
MPSQVTPWFVLTLTGELDMSRTGDLDQMASEVLGRDRVDVIADLTEVSFMDSSALRWLLNLQDQLGAASGRLRLVAPPGGILERLLSLSGLEGRFTVFATVVDASRTPTTKGEPEASVLASTTGIGAPTAAEGSLTPRGAG